MEIPDAASLPCRFTADSYFVSLNSNILSRREPLEVIVRTRLQELQAKSPETADEVAFQIIHHSRITPSVLKALRRKFLPIFSTIIYVEGCFPYFATGLNTLYNDHRSIPPYLLQRSRVPIDLVKEICGQLDISRKTRGDRLELDNEAAVQLYFHPIPP